MNLTDIEKTKIYEWAKKYNSPERSFCAEKRESFFTPVKEREPDIIFYGPENFPNILRELQKLWQDDEVMKKIAPVCAVAVMKHKPAEKDADEKNAVSDADDLTVPPFIYVF